MGRGDGKGKRSRIKSSRSWFDPLALRLPVCVCVFERMRGRLPPPPQRWLLCVVSLFWWLLTSHLLSSVSDCFSSGAPSLSLSTCLFFILLLSPIIIIIIIIWFLSPLVVLRMNLHSSIASCLSSGTVHDGGIVISLKGLQAIRSEISQKIIQLFFLFRSFVRSWRLGAYQMLIWMIDGGYWILLSEEISLFLRLK